MIRPILVLVLRLTSEVKVKVMLQPTVSLWGALSDERMGLSFTVYNVQYIYILRVIT
jgi:hypothetical protein